MALLSEDKQAELKQKVDAVLQRVVSDKVKVPGVVAGITDKDGNILYQGEAGVRSLREGSKPMTQDTIFAIYSTTKALTATAALRLYEEGKLDLDAPAKQYCPELGEVEILEGFDDKDQPILRKPKNEITTRMLLTHTAGFGYFFFNDKYKKLLETTGEPNILKATRKCLKTPLLFEPGTKWEYGTNMDWAGQVVEAITGKTLDAYLREILFEPCQMNNSSFIRNEDMIARQAEIHQRDLENPEKLTPLGDLSPTNPEVHMGGHGLYATVGDYLKFLQIWLNKGKSPITGAQVLKPETIEYASKNHLPTGVEVVELPAADPNLTHAAEFFPGDPKSWSISFMVNDVKAPTGRPAGSLCWAGLPNLYYWIDHKNGVAGYWATQLFPFADPTSVGGFFEMEAALYQTLEA